MKLFEPFRDDLPWLFTASGDIEIGPIPRARRSTCWRNLDLRPDEGSLLDRIEHDHKLVELVMQMGRDLKALPKNASDEQARQVFADLVDQLLELSKCPDFVVNRGHYFGTDLFAEEPGLSDQQKRELIEFLKTL